MRHKYIFFKRCAFTLLVLLIAIMAVATFVGNSKGIGYVTSHIYYSLWFAALWLAMTGCGLVWLWHTHPLRGKAEWRRNLHLWLVHGSLCLILLGASVSALTSWSGQVHLRQGEKTDVYMSEEEGNPYKRLPFSLELSQFDVATHRGTQMASNYISKIKSGGREYVISMNKVATVDGVRLYQASYDSDGLGSVLLVRCDRWGQPLTYAGYASLLFAMVFMLFAHNGGMCKAWRELRRLSLSAMLFFVAVGSYAQDGSGESLAPRVLPRDVAEDFGRLNVSYGGRICPVQTLAQDFCRKVYGKPYFKSFSAEQVMTGWLFWPDEWNSVPVIKVNSRMLRNRLDVEALASFNDFFFDGYRLGPMLSASDALGRAAREVDDRVMLVYSLRRGELFKFFPITNYGKTVWITPTEAKSTLDSVPKRDRDFITNVFTRMFQDALSGNNAKVTQGIRAISIYQKNHGGETLPNTSTIKAERIYNSFNLPTWLYRLNLTIGLLLFFISLRPKWNVARWAKLCAVAGVAGWVGLTVYMALRSTVSGRLPLGNGHETMLTVAWFVMLVGAMLWKKSKNTPALYSMPFLASGFFLLVASLSQSGAEISQLMPVLNSPLLSMHVSIIMFSYALLSFTFLISLAALIRPADTERLRWQSLVILYPAVALLATGIFLGAVWANVSWGRYWGWDPKEVWALITLLVYAVPLHASSISRMSRPRTYHIYMAVAFATVLMTYFGVNYVLTGLHSYA